MLVLPPDALEEELPLEQLPNRKIEAVSKLSGRALRTIREDTHNLTGEPSFIFIADSRLDTRRCR
jgi:hypothetical protein